MIKTDRIDVFMNEKHVGTLAETKHRAAFQYSEEWIEIGFSISPFSLPLEKRLFIPEYNPFEGVYGVFADSLPDGWGRFIVDRYINQKFKLNSDDIGNFQRLTLISASGMGALNYIPSIDITADEYSGSFDEIAQECNRLLEYDFPSDLDKLFKYGGSSGGARPKIHTKINEASWIIKFPSSYDSKSIGLQEYEYSLCAKECGIEMSDTKLFKSNICEGYFGTKRFDRKDDGSRIHMVSVSGLLETSHRYPNLDYNQLMKLTLLLTQDMQEVKKMFDLMCFNVYAHNRDDHSKNFSFLYNEDEGRWVLSPAYDLTYSSSQGGEHATTVNGEGKNPVTNDILQVGKKAGIDAGYTKSRSKEIQEIIMTRLNKYL
ncbi:MAG: type II toxin-antitoxin system HipA family toxin [Firmicutes bacterium]|nr:type II toxin-antitoxin system HipA family toxin [Bacillota bacterium]